ncbi:MAG TPA: acyl-CoA dehydrogenase, partial [Myxococcaceae bacterium]|nr:acyl-CoA dehydrogenase [Myxococcaceae bacterium]
GAHYSHWKDPSQPRVPIIQHPDVRRMLLDAKAHVEGIRALTVKLAWHHDRSEQLAGSDDAQAAYHRGQVELLTPLVKAYATDQAFRICGEMIQVYGGAGYLRDHPAEQYLRDAKIFSIYEGTNHIQATDLVGRKLGQAGGAHFQQFMGDVARFVEAQKAHPALGQAVGTLGQAQEALAGAAMQLLGWSQAGKLSLVLLNANRFLEMISEVAVGWLLLDAAAIAETARAQLTSGEDPDRAFYEGKVHAALYFARNVLPKVRHAAELMTRADTSALEIPEAAF